MKLRFAASLLAATVLGSTISHAAGDMISISLGATDIIRHNDRGAEVRVEYRSAHEYGFVKPFVALARTTTGSTFAGVGLYGDIELGEDFVLTPSFAPHLYSKGNAELDLDYVIQFRSQLELSYKLVNEARVGVAFSHYSNASLGKSNPGTEAASVSYTFPF